MTARYRSSPREARKPRGSLWESGYQYNPQDLFPIELGPWRAYDPEGDREQTLLLMSGAQVLHGEIVPRNVTHTALNSSAITRYMGAGRAYLDTQLGTIFVGTDALPNYDFYVRLVTDGGGQSEFDTGYNVPATPTERITFVSWGGKLYMGNIDIAGVYEVTSAPAMTLIGSAPSGVKYMGLLDKNVYAIVRPSGTTPWTVYWAVDSLPTDWANAGSGNNPILPTLGAVRGNVNIGEHDLIACQYGGLRMIPTGTLPAFRFETARGFIGCETEYDIASDGHRVYCIARDSRLNVWEDGKQLAVGSRNFFFKPSTTKLIYVQSMNHLVVSDYQNGGSYIFDIDSMEFVGQQNNQGAAALLDQHGLVECWYTGSSPNNQLGVRAFNLLDSGIPTLAGPLGGSAVAAKTHYFNLGSPTYIDRIEIYKRGGTYNSITCSFYHGNTAVDNTETFVPSLTPDTKFSGAGFNVFRVGLVCDFFAIYPGIFDGEITKIKVFCADPSGVTKGWMK